MAYPNGQVPFSVLVHLGANFWLPPGTAARWRWFVREGIRRYGVTFRITPDRDGLGGWNAYRPLAAQILYKKKYGEGAAQAGKSSHGGWYNNQEVFAIDVDNWGAVTWEQFASLANEAGFRVNFVQPKELWHIGDFNDPWVAPTEMENDMGTLDNTEANYQVFVGFLQRAFKFDARPNGVGANWQLGPTVFESLAGAQNKGITDAQVKTIADAVVKQIGTPTVSIDYAKIADTVRTKFATTPLK